MQVRFCDKVVVHRMVAWSFAYRKARKGDWERYSRDEMRFRCKVKEVENKIAWCLAPVHRNAVWTARYTHAAE